MKKILSVFAICLFALNGIQAKKWMNNIGVGLTIPISQIGIDEKSSDDIFQVGYGIGGTYVGIHENGFTAKANIDIGAATTKDISLQGDETNVGIFYNFDFGVGYSFIHTEKITFSLTGMAGLDMETYFDSEDDVSYDEKDCESVDRTFSLAELNIGADLFFAYHIKEHFGFFANLSTRYLIVGSSKENIEWSWKSKTGGTRKESEDKDGPDLAGKFRIQPTIGVIWNF